MTATFHQLHDIDGVPATATEPALTFMGKRMQTIDDLLADAHARLDRLTELMNEAKQMFPYPPELLEMRKAAFMAEARRLELTHAETELGTHTIISGGEVLELSKEENDRDIPF